MKRLLPLLFAFGCSSSPQNTPMDASVSPDLAEPIPTDRCGATPASLCTPANPGSVVRGVASFDASHFKPGQKVSLALFLQHQFPYLGNQELTTGGHPHAYKYLPDVDVSKGQVAFSIDLCELGTAMWSEENCGFNLVAMLDENGSNDVDTVGEPGFHADPGELVKMAPLTISCHAASPCLTLTLDCTSGETCTTYPAPAKCTCAADHCPSDSAICKL